ncbi:hypothetical protein SKAU_G00317950 [Synaphobranchus kaupii]|uniref:Uncharacterized protein n=1 Tax=Synaphobranchus kaupii TaxID=118154 RepID=A0A9Q1ESZ1_SYNKA|nr:hypothetical protein SKAU_G00317950 [Synaphobranchus kaupii]
MGAARGFIMTKCHATKRRHSSGASDPRQHLHGGHTFLAKPRDAKSRRLSPPHLQLGSIRLLCHPTNYSLRNCLAEPIELTEATLFYKIGSAKNVPLSTVESTVESTVVAALKDRGGSFNPFYSRVVPEQRGFYYTAVFRSRAPLNSRLIYDGDRHRLISCRGARC